MDMTLAGAWFDPPAQSDPSAELPRLSVGPLYLASAIRQAGYDLELRDSQTVTHNPEQPLHQQFEVLLEGSAPLLGISTMSDFLPMVILALRGYKARHKETTVVLGGVGPSSVAPALMEHFPWIDAVCVGEGEEALPRLIAAFRDHGGYPDQVLGEIPGLWYRRDGKGAFTGKPVRIADTEIFHPLPYDLVDLSCYSRRMPIITTRGCPYRCAFCANHAFWGRRVVRRSINSVTQEIVEHVPRRGCDYIAFLDDTFVLDRKWLSALLQELRQMGIRFSWHCYGRIDLVDEAWLEYMAENGCVSIFYGVESGSPHVLERIPKGFTPEQAKDVVQLSSKYMHVWASFIWGFPYETLADFEATRRLYLSLLELENAVIELQLLTPFPGTRLYETYKDQLQFTPELCADLATTRALSREEIALVSSLPEVFPNYYHFPSPHLDYKAECVHRLFELFGPPEGHIYGEGRIYEAV